MFGTITGSKEASLLKIYLRLARLVHDIVQCATSTAAVLVSQPVSGRLHTRVVASLYYRVAIDPTEAGGGFSSPPLNKSLMSNDCAYICLIGSILALNLSHIYRKIERY